MQDLGVLCKISCIWVSTCMGVSGRVCFYTDCGKKAHKEVEYSQVVASSQRVMTE